MTKRVIVRGAGADFLPKTDVASLVTMNARMVGGRRLAWGRPMAPHTDFKADPGCGPPSAELKLTEPS